MLKKVCVALLSAVWLLAGTLAVSAVLDGELELDGAYDESEIWDSGHRIFLNEEGIIPGSSGITYAELNYLIDENQKRMFLYIRYCDETTGDSLDKSGFTLQFSDGCRLFLSASGLETGTECADVGYCVRILRPTDLILEAQLDFHTISGAKKAMQELTVFFSDRTGEKTGAFTFEPVYPALPGASEESAGGIESEIAQSDPTESTRKESTTRKKSTPDKGKSSSGSGKSRTTEEYGESFETGRFFDYTVTDGGEDRYRAMTILLILLIVLLCAVIGGGIFWSQMKEEREKEEMGCLRDIQTEKKGGEREEAPGSDRTE